MRWLPGQPCAADPELLRAVQRPGGEADVLGSPGTYGWSGAYNTYFRIDPREKLVLAIFTQLSPANDLEVTYGFQNLVMQAIVE